MSRTDSISLQESVPPSSFDEHRTDSGQLVLQDVTSSDAKPWDTKTRRTCVLAGAALSQLPIWGFAMSYGIFQEYYHADWTFSGDKTLTGIIGTTSNGVMYLLMPLLFGMYTRRWARWRQLTAVCGALIAGLSFLLSSYSTSVLHLVLTQGIFAALGCTLMYSPTTLSLGEWYNTHNRAVAYGITLSCKNITGSACPFMFQALLDRFGFRVAVRIWAGILVGTGIAAILLIPTHPTRLTAFTNRRARKLPWSFLRHQTIYVYSVAIVLQSAGYGLPQSYINSYARDVTGLSTSLATLLLVLFNVPGIASSSFFGWLCDNRRFTLSAAATTAASAFPAALAVLLFWGLTPHGHAGLALLVLFSVTFGFFASGYSACWGGVLNLMEREAAERNEAVDGGMLYGLLNGVRGVGYVAGGLVAIPLLRLGGGAGAASSASAKFAYGTSYGPLIIFTGLASAFGGWGLLWKSGRLERLWTACSKWTTQLK